MRQFSQVVLVASQFEWRVRGPGPHFYQKEATKPQPLSSPLKGGTIKGLQASLVRLQDPPLGNAHKIVLTRIAQRRASALGAEGCRVAPTALNQALSLERSLNFGILLRVGTLTSDHGGAQALKPDSSPRPSKGDLRRFSQAPVRIRNIPPSHVHQVILTRKIVGSNPTSPTLTGEWRNGRRTGIWNRPLKRQSQIHHSDVT